MQWKFFYLIKVTPALKTFITELVKEWIVDFQFKYLKLVLHHWTGSCCHIADNKGLALGLHAWPRDLGWGQTLHKIQQLHHGLTVSWKEMNNISHDTDQILICQFAVDISRQACNTNIKIILQLVEYRISIETKRSALSTLFSTEYVIRYVLSMIQLSIYDNSY